MSVYNTLNGMRKGIKLVNPQMSEEQIRAEAERHVTEALHPMYSEQQIFEMLEGDDYRREGVAPRPIPHYSREERAERREFARRLRHELYQASQDHGMVEEVYGLRLNEGRLDPRRGAGVEMPQEERQRLDADARKFSRGTYWMFYFPGTPERFFREHPDATQEDFKAEQQLISMKNEEIAFLFDTNDAHWDQYYAEAVPHRRRTDPTMEGKSDAEVRATIENELSRRRGEVLMRCIREATSITDQLDEMTDPSLPPEVLGDNFSKIVRAKGMIMDIDHDFLSRTDCIFTEEERQQLLYWRDEEQSLYSTAHDRIVLRATPLYELFDPEILADYDIESMHDDYQNELVDNRKYRSQQERKYPDTQRYASLGGGKGSDSLDDLLRDAGASTIMCRDQDIDARYQSKVESYGFTLGEDGADCTCDEYDKAGKRSLKENAGVEELKSGRPLLFRQDGRVAVLTLKSPFSATMTWDKPEALFNYGLEHETDALCKQLKASDKWYQTRSDNFRRMREAFEDLAKESKPLNDRRSERSAAMKKYESVLKLCNAYLEKKQGEGVGDGHNDLEKGHIAVARAMEKFLTRKMDEIRYVEQARADLAKYRGMTGEQIRADIAREQKYQEKGIRRQNLSNWISGSVEGYRRNNDLPETVADAIRDGGVGLTRGLFLDPQKPSQLLIPSTDRTQEYAADFAGGMIAAEMIRAEREQRAAQEQEGMGPVERAFSENNEATQERIRDLGEDAIREVTGKLAGTLDSETLTKFVASVDAEQLAREMPTALELKANIEKDAREAAEQAEREAREAAEQAEREAREAADKPLREEQDKLSKVGLGVYTFAQKDIVPLMDKLRGALAGGQTTYSLRDSVDLLSSYVILGMIQLEELGGSSKLTRAMRDDEVAKTLQVNLQMTKGFGDMLKEIAAEDGNTASIEKISRVLAEKKPQELARQILTDTKFKQGLESHMKEHGIELGKGFKLGEKNEQKHEQQPVQQAPNK